VVIGKDEEYNTTINEEKASMIIKSEGLLRRNVRRSDCWGYLPCKFHRLNLQEFFFIKKRQNSKKRDK